MATHLTKKSTLVKPSNQKIFLQRQGVISRTLHSSLEIVLKSNVCCTYIICTSITANKLSQQDLGAHDLKVSIPSSNYKYGY